MFKRLNTVTAPRMAGSAQARYLNLHEYSCKKLLQDFGVKTEQGYVASTVDEVNSILPKIKTDKKVVKSQILAGGRGKGHFADGYQGGVHVCENTAAALEAAKKMLHNKLITKQTGGKAVEVKKLYLTEAIPKITKEMYVALVLDRKTCSPTFIASAEGGTGIEELAKNSPEKIKTLAVSIHEGINEAASIKFAKSLGLEDTSAELFAQEIAKLYNVAKAKDCTMVEINPMVQVEDGSILSIDAKLGFDESAQFRRPEIWEQADTAEKDAKEVKADAADLNYIALDGNVGCLVNGAGLAMATMDAISLYGQTPANFLDVGGSAQAKQIVEAFDIISSDPNVNIILVNIFGGIMRCDVIAQGVVDAVKILGDKFQIPLVVRLVGTKEEEGKKILTDSGMAIYAVDDLDQAGAKVAEIAANLKK